MGRPLHTGYQNIQSLVGLSSGGIAGSGLGASRAKWGFLPYAHSDFIFAVIGEELGLVGSTVVVGLYVLLGIIGIRIALHAPDRFGLLLATGVTAWFCVQAFVNIGAVIGILPITGVPLPFVSAGGSSLVFGMAGAGLLLSVARQATVRPRPAPPRSGGRGAGGGAMTAGHGRLPPQQPLLRPHRRGGTAGHVQPAIAIARALVAAATSRARSSWWAASGASRPGWCPPPASS